MTVHNLRKTNSNATHPLKNNDLVWVARGGPPKQVTLNREARISSAAKPESSVCQEKLIFFGCEIVVVYTSRHFVQIKESETGAAAAAAALLRFLCGVTRRRRRWRRRCWCWARAYTSASFSISSPKDTTRGTPALRTAAAPPMGALRFGASPGARECWSAKIRGVERKSPSFGVPEGGSYHHPFKNWGC